MSFKKKLHAHCHKLVDERMELAHKLIKEAQLAASQDSKSSMGDKYETSREMMALEMRKAGEQLQENSKLKQVLSELSIGSASKKVLLGSLIATSIGEFYLSASLGQIKVDEREIFVLSAVSPLGKQLVGKQKGDSFIFNSKNIEIIAIT